ncbi:hypothetical protein [Nocardia lasii]|uniref:Uncharacterized protein n=1 Tax=Nocardia lasii TaxID=1616107 RepID=A0ABW1JVM4_9NOCA
MSSRTQRFVAGAVVAAALSLAAPAGIAQAAPLPVADSGSASWGCTSTDINPCPIRPLLDMWTWLLSGSG